MRAEQMLPDHADRIEVGGTTIRKGTVGAFLVNARVLTDPNAAPAERARAEADAAAALPALRALGLFDVLELNAVHAKMHRELAAVGARVEAVFYCPHAPDEECRCRKPAPALFEQIAERYGAEGQEIWAIGSGVEHLQAGRSLGAHLVYIGPPADGGAQEALPEGTAQYPDLNAVVNDLLPLGGESLPAGQP